MIADKNSRPGPSSPGAPARQFRARQCRVATARAPLLADYHEPLERTVKYLLTST